MAAKGIDAAIRSHVKSLERDRDRLEWLAEARCMICRSRDGDMYWLSFDRPDEDAPLNQKRGYDSPREAIDAAMKGLDP